ncbi:HpaII family restriction endonuclease [Bacteroides sp.]|uniref:HpaII family restriction endonuclease n=1 Tax=Bacteroides sp. TaxID=29523 RepID=UPI001B66E4F3|nr:HpaII family restriction endonuclease [Bacteroides sp.]MBP6065669.1 HpaII family restriction endonuclease [Bacteroides sp.]MBP6068024.1 HpaII family restriction endonuclease [Bacteroides sp.]MBP6936851.1 HpaII family restriction endonuclease [Bacteroides sp.]MBP8622294.1 HpaII family restriction endonuclease [Bacteroides sp.]MBP9507672.1 HpaII family restriction endonuclease [Bacteroides sp.]
MALEATKREWSELYTFLRLLADGEVALGTPQGKRNEERAWPIAMIQREEYDGTRQYILAEEGVSIRHKDEPLLPAMPREQLDKVAQLILAAIKASTEDVVASPPEVEAFLNEFRIYDLEAVTEDRTDLSIAFWHVDAPLVGFSVRSKLSGMNPLLDGGRTANLKFEQTGVKFSTPAVSNINASSASALATEVADRMMMIERLGGGLKYADVADRVFRCNLLMIDLHFPRLLAEMVRTMHLESIVKVSELTKLMRETNPLKIKEELIEKHGYYEFKVKQFLMTLALGMRPAKIYNGTDSAIEGMLILDGSGEVICYHKSEKQVFEEFLFLNSRFEKGSVEKDKYGFLEKENGVYYFKLNAKIGLAKR